MRHVGVFSNRNYPENSHMCLLFVSKSGKKKKKNGTEKALFEVPCVLSVGTCGALSCIPCKFFVRYLLITLTPCVLHLACMCLELSGRKTVEGRGGGGEIAGRNSTLTLKQCLCSSAQIWMSYLSSTPRFQLSLLP